MSSRWRILAPVTIILLPAIFWLLLTRGHNEFKKLPYVGPYEVNAKGDTVYHTIPSFQFTNQENKVISDADLKGKFFVANFFFATCKTICPKMNEQVKRVQDAFINEKDFQIITITVDPESDTVEALAEYAKKMKADNNRWWFLTGNKDSIYDLARNGFLVPAAIGAQGDFFHSQDLMLIDKDRKMRGLYDGTEEHEVDTLIDEIKVLMKEYGGSNF